MGTRWIRYRVRVHRKLYKLVWLHTLPVFCIYMSSYESGLMHAHQCALSYLNCHRTNDTGAGTGIRRRETLPATSPWLQLQSVTSLCHPLLKMPETHLYSLARQTHFRKRGKYGRYTGRLLFKLSMHHAEHLTTHVQCAVWVSNCMCERCH